MNKTIQQCPSCTNLQKRLKVLQADYDFEIKKLNEDKSAQKAMYQLYTNKQIRKLAQKCQKQKQERIKENQNWMKKYDQLIEKQKQQMYAYRLQKDKQLGQFKVQKNEQIQKFKQKIVTTLQEQIKDLKQSKETLKIQITAKLQNKILQEKSFYQEKIQKLIHRYEEQMKKKCGQYEAVIVGVQSEKTVEQNLHKKTKQDSKQSQSKLLQQMYSLKRNIIDYEQKIQILNSQIQQKAKNIESLKTEIIQKQNQYTQEYRKLSQQYDGMYQSHKKIMETKLEMLFKKELQNCTKYEKALQKIQQHRDIENKMYKANLNDIKGCVQDRPSRLEDVQEIIKLRQKLVKKQKQCESLFEQLKWYKLQLQNKEETYNKIFGPDSKNNQNIYIRRKDLKLKRAGKSVTTVRQILGSVNNTNYLAPLVHNLQKKILPPKQNKIL